MRVWISGGSGFDTSLDARATAAALGVALPGVDEQLRRLERSLACTT